MSVPEKCLHLYWREDTYEPMVRHYLAIMGHSNDKADYIIAKAKAEGTYPVFIWELVPNNT